MISAKHQSLVTLNSFGIIGAKSDTIWKILGCTLRIVLGEVSVDQLRYHSMDQHQELCLTAPEAISLTQDVLLSPLGPGKVSTVGPHLLLEAAPLS